MECSISWCDRLVKCRGYCEGHYTRYRNGTDMDKPFRYKKRKHPEGYRDKALTPKWGSRREHLLSDEEWSDKISHWRDPSLLPDAKYARPYDKLLANSREVPNESLGTPCLEWTGSTREGYGQLNWRGYNWTSHRIAYVDIVGGIEREDMLDHKCWNTICFAIDHLQPVSSEMNAENRSPGSIYSKSGVRNVHWSSTKNKWKAQVSKKGYKYNGPFRDSVEEARKDAILLRAKYFTNYSEH